ncbi:MAG: signal peptidase I [Candidatus Woesearchaeota archaeon]
MSQKRIFPKTWNTIKDFWKFLAYDNSPWSMVLIVVIAFFTIVFIIFPALSFILQTPLPLVAVVSGSMEHRGVEPCITNVNGICVNRADRPLRMCGQTVGQRHFTREGFWDVCGSWYEEHVNITFNDFIQFPFSHGFNTGDAMVIRGQEPEDLQVGSVIIFISDTQKPIIHRIVALNMTDEGLYITTKGDHNERPQAGFPDNEVNISYEQYVGTAIFRVPYVAYVRLWVEVLLSALR